MKIRELKNKISYLAHFSQEKCENYHLNKTETSQVCATLVAQKAQFQRKDQDFLIFRPYFIWDKKIFKSFAFFQTKFAMFQIYIQNKGLNHRIQLT